MAQQVIITVECDFAEGRPGHEEDVQAFQFPYNGKTYEADGCAACRQEVAGVMAPYVKNAHVAKGGKSTLTARQAASHTERLTRMRMWARENGLAVKERGRIPAPIVAAYDAAHDNGGTF